MENKILAERYYAGTIYGDIEYNELMSILEKAKKDIELLYPEVLTNGHPMRVEFDYNTEYCDTEVNIIYIRHETDAECEARREAELKTKAANTMALRKAIDANKSDAIEYLKSIGAI
jgi:hypothetical protein